MQAGWGDAMFASVHHFPVHDELRNFRALSISRFFQRQLSVHGISRGMDEDSEKKSGRPQCTHRVAANKEARPIPTHICTRKKQSLVSFSSIKPQCIHSQRFICKEDFS